MSCSKEPCTCTSLCLATLGKSAWAQLCSQLSRLQFNLRETSNIIGNLCRMTKDVHKQPLQVGQHSNLQRGSNATMRSL
jgi:hypothetical protein